MANRSIAAPCRCGKVELEIAASPILRGICYCSNCREAGLAHQAVPGADICVAPDGGTDYVLYRKDRVRCISGGEFLEARRLKPASPTLRMFARCCNTAMYLDFTKGHWLSIYRGRLPDDMPPATMRIMIAERPEGVSLPDDMANYAGFPSPTGRPFLKLLGAWMAMGFKRPAIEGVPED
jgi:hypothetical protein